jgi:hypothetical protein
MIRFRHSVAIAALAAGSFACGDDPAPAPTTPVATPAPTPAPTPTPAASLGCGLPPMPDLRNECPKLTPELWEFVENAIQKTIREHPAYFDFTDDLGGGAYRVLNRDGYMKAVVANIQGQGVCAHEEIEEIQVKNSNAFNEQYNIWVSSGHVRHGPRSYITTCFPAQF